MHAGRLPPLLRPHRPAVPAFPLLCPGTQAPPLHLHGPRSCAQVDPARRLPATHRDEELPLLGGASNALTRRAGGRAPSRPDPKRVVVDVREFMSSLPAVLHQQASGAGWVWMMGR